MSEASVAVTVPPHEAVIAKPIGKEHFARVRARKYYEHPNIQKIFGEPYADMSSLRGNYEHLVIGDGPPAPGEGATRFRVSREPNMGGFIAGLLGDGIFGHHRSIHHRLDAEKRSPVVTDKDVVVINGVEYAGISTKGADFNDVYLEPDGEFASGFKIHGAVTLAVAGQMKRVSEKLQERGIPSEVVLRISHLDELPIPDPDNPGSFELVSQQKYKEWLIEKAIRDNPQLPRNKRIDIKKARKWLESPDSNLVVVTRALMPFRLSDLVLPFRVPDRYASPQEAFKDFAFMANYAISFANRSRDEDKQLPSIVIPTDENDTEAAFHNKEAITRFFDYFARRFGNTIASLHNENMYHNYFHPGNIPLDGAICDNDSIGGVPLGASFFNRSVHGNKDNDVGKTLASLYETTSILTKAGVISKEMSVEIGRVFIQQYVNSSTSIYRIGSTLFRIKAMSGANMRDVIDINFWLNDVFKGLVFPTTEN